MRTKQTNTERASLREVAAATYPDSVTADDPDAAARLWLSTRTRAEAGRWRKTELQLYANVPLTARSPQTVLMPHRHRWTPWRQSNGMFENVERRKCRDCRDVQERPVRSSATEVVASMCRHEGTQWTLDPTRPRNRTEKRRGPRTEHGTCPDCGRRITRTSPSRRAA